MAEFKVTKEKFKSDLVKLQNLLIVLTVIQVIYLSIMFTDTKLWVKLNFDYKAGWLILILNLIITGIFIWFNWTKMPIEKKTKTNNTFLILFLGIIGMWLWIPSKPEINRLIEK
jgi:hypothetical protein